jgi:hypothetical protein
VITLRRRRRLLPPVHRHPPEPWPPASNDDSPERPVLCQASQPTRDIDHAGAGPHADLLSCLDGWAGSDFLREMTLTYADLDGGRPGHPPPPWFRADVRLHKGGFHADRYGHC